MELPNEEKHTEKSMALGFNWSISSQCTDLHAVVTDAAVGAARRPVEVTGGAPLHAHLNALHVHVLVERRTELVVLVLVLVCCGWKGGGREPRQHRPAPLFTPRGSSLPPFITHPLAARRHP